MDTSYFIIKDSIFNNTSETEKIIKHVNLLLKKNLLLKLNQPVYFYVGTTIHIYENGEIKMIHGNEKFYNKIDFDFQKKITNSFWSIQNKQGVTCIKKIKGIKLTFETYLPDIIINRVYEDKEKNFWFTSKSKGVFLIPNHYINTLHFTKADGLIQEDTRVFYKDKQNTIWAGATQNILYSIQLGVLKKHNIPLSHGAIKTEVTDICEDKQGNLLVSNVCDLVLYRKKAGIKGFNFIEIAHPNSIKINGNYKSLSINSEGILLAASSHKLSFYNPKDKTGKISLMSFMSQAVRVHHAFYDRKGNSWIANSDGLNRLIVDSLKGLYQLNSLLKEPIAEIAETQDGNLLLASQSKGVFVFNGSDVLQVFSEKDGLASNICHKLFIDNNKIWVATAKGISQLFYLNKKLTFGRNYTTDDGLLSNEINDVITLNDTIYVASAEGISLILNQKTENTNPPPIYITRVQYGDINILNSVDRIFNYNQTYLKFNFVAITFQQPEKVTYNYRLNNGDNTWKTNTSGSVDYPALLPGKYTFEIKAKKKNSNWSLPKTFSFTIKAPFWMQDWFYIIVCSVLITVLAAIVYYFSKRSRLIKFKKAELQNRMFHLEQQALSALMNPHFIFNALNSIQQFLHNNDNLSANKYLSLFAKLTRQNMEAVMKNSVSLEDELERLKLYLNFEKLRFGNKLKYKIIIPDEINIDELILPPMILQPFVENAIWHGLMLLPNGGEIIITVNLLDENNFQVLIKDTGIGIDTSKGRKHGQELKHNSKGIQLSIERLQLWTKSKDKKLDLKIEQLQQNNLLNGGTLVSLILPRKID